MYSPHLRVGKVWWHTREKHTPQGWADYSLRYKLESFALIVDWLTDWFSETGFLHATALAVLELTETACTHQVWTDYILRYKLVLLINKLIFTYLSIYLFSQTGFLRATALAVLELIKICLHNPGIDWLHPEIQTREAFHLSVCVSVCLSIYFPR